MVVSGDFTNYWQFGPSTADNRAMAEKRHVEAIAQQLTDSINAASDLISSKWFPETEYFKEDKLVYGTDNQVIGHITKLQE